MHFTHHLCKVPRAEEGRAYRDTRKLKTFHLFLGELDSGPCYLKLFISPSEYIQSPTRRLKEGRSLTAPGWTVQSVASAIFFVNGNRAATSYLEMPVCG